MNDPNVMVIRNDNIYNLQISEDDGWQPEDPIVVLLFTPQMEDKFDHYHIELSIEQVEKTRDWLTAFLDRHKKNPFTGIRK